MTTHIEDLSADSITNIKLKDLDDNELYTLISDLSIGNDVRFESIILYFNQFGEESTLELINKFCLMYQFSGTSVLQKFLYTICMETSKLTSFIKALCAKSLICFQENEEKIEEDDEIETIKLESNNQVRERNENRLKKGYECLNKVCSEFDDLPTPYKVELLLMLVLCETYINQSLIYFCELVNNQNIECDYRYKVMLSLENKNIPNKGEFIQEIFISFLTETKNMTMYKILCAQYLLQYNSNDNSIITLSNEICLQIQDIVMSFAKDEELDYNIRADSADMLLNLGNEVNKLKAMEIIMNLGRTINSKSISIFDNSQNVHTREIEQSLQESLEYLVRLPLLKIDNKNINFEWVNETVQELFNIPETQKCTDENCVHDVCKLCSSCIEVNDDDPTEFCNNECSYTYGYRDKVNVSLNRIYLDRCLYSQYSQTLLNILLKVVSFIFSHDDKNELLIRLKEELYDMSGTCSTGFASRLINTLSGYDDFNIKISFTDQIVANFIARVNKKLQHITENNLYYTTKHREIVWLYMKNNNLTFKKETMEQLMAKENNKDTLIDEFLKVDKSQKVEEAVIHFADNVLIEMLERNNYTNRPYFIHFFRNTVPEIKEELYNEFKDYVSDIEFDLAIRSAILNYESSEKIL